MSPKYPILAHHSHGIILIKLLPGVIKYCADGLAVYSVKEL